MQITQASFIKSAADKSGFLTFDKPVFAVCGRSNVGKSSFINMLTGRKKLAKTSREPGRTRLVNYFDLGEFVLADLPGYGYAQVSKGEKLKWAKTLEDFFKIGNVAHALALVDIRHDPSRDDVDFINYLNHYVIPFTVVCTKADKLSKTRIKPAAKKIADFLALGEGNVIAVSNESGFGKDSVLNRIECMLNAIAERSNGEDFSEDGGDNGKERGGNDSDNGGNKGGGNAVKSE